MQNPANGPGPYNEVVPPVVPVVEEEVLEEKEMNKEKEVKPEDFKPFNLDAVEEMPDDSEQKPNE